MYNVIKRLSDFLLALIALIILLPLLIPICIALLLTGEHEVFYFQKRIGYKQKPFYIWKFATMLKNSEKIGTGLITLRNDSRVTPVGRFLRKTKINELPQIVNVILGSMSIVGPRPLVEKGFNQYPEALKPTIAASKPGLTGIGSIVFRDEELYLSKAENPAEYYERIIQPYKAELEVWYFYNKSLWTDLKIILLTIVVILNPNYKHINKWLKDLPQKELI